MPSGPYRKKFSCKSSREQGFFFGPFFKKWHVSVFSSFTDFHTCYAHYSPCSFNGKEKDYESGFHYYGARYYWSEILTSWLSVDPMADKYPSMSPYAYCAWNPVKLVDLDGRDWYRDDETGGVFWSSKNDKTIEYKGALYRNIGTSYKTYKDGFVIQYEIHEMM